LETIPLPEGAAQEYCSVNGFLDLCIQGAAGAGSRGEQHSRQGQRPPWEMQSHSSQAMEQSTSGGSNPGQHVPVSSRQVAAARQAGGQAGKSSRRVRIFIRGVHGKAQAWLQQLRKGQRRSVRA